MRTVIIATNPGGYFAKPKECKDYGYDITGKTLFPATGAFLKQAYIYKLDVIFNNAL